MSHTMTIVSTFDDGHESSWFYIQPGTAEDAHRALARRWRDAKAVFEQDRATLTLRRAYEIRDDRGGVVRYVDEITHEDHR